MARKKVKAASEEEIGKLHQNAVKLLNLGLDSLLEKIDKNKELAGMIDVNDLTKILKFANDEGIKSTDADEDGTSDLSKKVKQIKEKQGNKVIQFLDNEPEIKVV